MQFEYSNHWKKRLLSKKRSDITEDVLEYALTHSAVFRDDQWLNASNAIARVPPFGRTVKVVYRKISPDTVKIITAFWID